VAARAVVLATGVSYRQLDAPGIADLIGAGVFYGSALSEAPAIKDQDVFIAGAGNSAGQAAVYLSRSARSVTLLVRGDTLAKSMSDYLVKEIDATPRVRARLQTEVAAARGDRRLTELVLRDRRTGRHETVAGRGAVRHDRRHPAHRLATRRCQARPARVHPDRPRPAQPGAGRGGSAGTSSAGNQPAGSVRRRRRTCRLGEAGGLGRGRDRSPSPRSASTCSATPARQPASRVPMWPLPERIPPQATAAHPIPLLQ
jgi:Pyridine nucleotide-disulphide oxidoreductase